MKGRKTIKLWTLQVVAVLCMVLTPLRGTAATTHTITFGEYFYSPSSLIVSVGDTIVWQGDFSFHPMSSASIPLGAASWQFATGSSNSYIVTVAGAYNYGCNAHSVCCNMTASFNATAVSVGEDPNAPLLFQLEQNFPNPFNPTTTIRYAVPAAQFVMLKVFDVAGAEIATLVNEKRPAGSYAVEFNGKGLASGIYLYQLEAEGRVATKKLLLIK